VTAGDASNNKIKNPTALKGMQHQMMQTASCEANAWRESQIDGTKGSGERKDDSSEIMQTTKKTGRNAGCNADASAKDALLNKKSHGICRNGHLQKIGKGRAKCRPFHRGRTAE
jgi:hypothetical protein